MNASFSGCPILQACWTVIAKIQLEEQAHFNTRLFTFKHSRRAVFNHCRGGGSSHPPFAKHHTYTLSGVLNDEAAEWGHAIHESWTFDCAGSKSLGDTAGWIRFLLKIGDEEIVLEEIHVRTGASRTAP